MNFAIVLIRLSPGDDLPNIDELNSSRFDADGSNERKEALDFGDEGWLASGAAAQRASRDGRVL